MGLSVTPATPAAAGTASTTVRLIAFNDFHGNLQPPAGSSGRVTLPDGTTVDAGGAAYLATHLKRLRTKNSIVVSSGDNAGASPLVSALFHDEPTMALLDELDLPAAPPFTIELAGGVQVGIIGVTLEDLPKVVTPEAIEGLEFGDEVEAIDRSSRLLDLLGVRTQVVLVHQGDNTEGGGPDECRTLPGPATEIATKASASVDVFFTGHSHQQYSCTVTDPAGNPPAARPGRLVRSAAVRCGLEGRQAHA